MERNYLIMSGDTITAKWENRKLSVINEKLLPLYLKRVHDADMWLETRAIDSHRANSRLLKKALRLKEKDDINTVIHVNAATITDNYWIKPLDSDLAYGDIRFSDDYFSDLALKGDYSSFNDAANSNSGRTPELTNIGSFEKCWKLIDGKWWMIKTANQNELFSELFIYHFGKASGLNMALYEKSGNNIRTLDFTDGASVNFEPAFSFMDDNEDYEDTYKMLSELCPDAAADYVRMVFLDTVTANPDRHTANFGLLRNNSTGALIGLAPLFDHNMALISRGYPKIPTSNDFLIRLFNEFVSYHPDVKKDLPQITCDAITQSLNKTDMPVNREYIIELLMKRYELIDI